MQVSLMTKEVQISPFPTTNGADYSLVGTLLQFSDDYDGICERVIFSFIEEHPVG